MKDRMKNSTNICDYKGCMTQLIGQVQEFPTYVTNNISFCFIFSSLFLEFDPQIL